MSHALPSPSVDDSGPPHGWVPVERRWFGLDRRSLLPGAVVAVVAVLMSGVVPFVNDSIPWNNPIAAGDRVALGPQVVITPPVGWQLVSGVRVGERTVAAPSPAASLSDAGLTVLLGVEPLPDGVDALLDTVINETRGSEQGSGLRPESDPVHLTTAGGLTGVTRRWNSPSAGGVVAVIAVPPADGSRTPIGVVIQASGAGAALDAVGGDVDQIIRSVTRSDSA